MEQKLIKTNIEISEKIDKAANKIDIYLVGEKVTEKTNKSRVFLESFLVFKEREKPALQFNIGGELKLPNLEEHWRLKFSNRDKTKERGQAPRYSRAQQEANDSNRSIGAGLSFWRNIGTVKLNYQPQVLLRERPGLSHSIEFDSSSEYENLKVEAELEFFANADIGTGIAHALNFIYKINDFKSIKFSNDGKYVNQTHVYYLTHSLTYELKLNDRSSLSYSTYLAAINRDVYHTNEQGLSVTYNHTIYKKILDFSITPHLIFNEEVGYRGVPGLSLGFILNF